MSEINDQTSPDPEAVKEFLRQQGGEQDSADAEEVQLDLDILQEENSQRDAEVPGVMKYDAQARAELYRNQIVPEIRNVEVTQAEKDKFRQGVVTDEPFETVVPLQGGFRVRVRSCTLGEQDLVAQAVGIMQKRAAREDTGWVFTEMDYVQYVQDLMLMFQVMEINGIPFKHRVETEHDTELQNAKNSYERARLLLTRREEAVKEWSHESRAVCMYATRLFTAKQAVLTDHLYNDTENFWEPAASS